MKPYQEKCATFLHATTFTVCSHGTRKNLERASFFSAIPLCETFIRTWCGWLLPLRRRVWPRNDTWKLKVLVTWCRVFLVFPKIFLDLYLRPFCFQARIDSSKTTQSSTLGFQGEEIMKKSATSTLRNDGKEDSPLILHAFATCFQEEVGLAIFVHLHHEMFFATLAESTWRLPEAFRLVSRYDNHQQCKSP